MIQGDDRKTDGKLEGDGEVKRVNEILQELVIQETSKKEIDLQGKRLRFFEDFESLHVLDSNSVLKLNMSENGIKSWETISRIVAKFPNLKELDVTSNPCLPYISDLPLTDVLEHKKTFASVTTVSANGLGYPWGGVMTCVREMWSDRLRHLSLNHNMIHYMSDPGDALEHLVSIDLSANPIKGWQEVAKLGDLPSLKSLTLKDCGIKTISLLPDDTDLLSDQFIRLKKLDLFHNEISDWTSVLELTRLQCLEDIDLQFNPIMSSMKNFMEADITMNALFGRYASKINGHPYDGSFTASAEEYLAIKIYEEMTLPNYPVVRMIKQSFLEEAEEKMKSVALSFLQEIEEEKLTRDQLDDFLEGMDGLDDFLAEEEDCVDM